MKIYIQFLNLLLEAVTLTGRGVFASVGSSFHTFAPPKKESASAYLSVGFESEWYVGI